ncbi:hypothetical protein QQX98_004947 [Neonectria punicea]|uniref:protein-ribulosamine 3-kinase n=1 Tax=Neonectria punicea TaxID=979145 RepID=A0ABR1H6Y7_9HYPO
MSGEISALIAAKLSQLGMSTSSPQKLDTNVISGIYYFPEDLRADILLSVLPSGASAWVQTVRIECELEDGSIANFFMKSKSGEEGRRMMEGSFESESMFHHYSPSNVPKPLAWGCFHSDPDMWFYLCHFHYMLDGVPEPQEFVAVIAQVHKTSMGNSPMGKYGFQVPTHLANIPNDNTWQSSWEAWFTQAMRQMFAVEEKAHGKNDELELLKGAFYDKVIPRLLRPLETGGNTIQPCLIHSDLWPGNCMADNDTGNIIVFDSCAFWGHNEADLGSWRAPRYKMGRPFFKEYQKEMGISEPKGDWDDRNALYAL